MPSRWSSWSSWSSWFHWCFHSMRVCEESPTSSGITVMAIPCLILWSGLSPEGTYIGDSDQSLPLISCLGHSIASLAKYLETLGLVSKLGSLVEFGLSHLERRRRPLWIQREHTTSTGRLYALRWKMFVYCCRNRIHLFPILCAGWDVKTLL